MAGGRSPSSVPEDGRRFVSGRHVGYRAPLDLDDVMDLTRLAVDANQFINRAVQVNIIKLKLINTFLKKEEKPENGAS